MGGDEFLVAMAAETESVQERVELFNRLISQWSGKYINTLTVSYGIAAAKEHPDLDFEELLKTADSMMYDRKKQQTGRY
jgi:diguanylate cyclase (GGDEF)-like protein